MMEGAPLKIVGRSSSHYTRVVLLHAELLGLQWSLQPVDDLQGQDPEKYAGNPAMKIPVLVDGSTTLFGTQNICRALCHRAPAQARARLRDESGSPMLQNAQELVWHCMAAQVQLVMGTVLSALPAESPYFTKIRAGLEGSLAWLDDRADALLPDRLGPAVISPLEITLFCLMEHLTFRPTVDAGKYERLAELTQRFGQLEVARRTAYRFDKEKSAHE